MPQKERDKRLLFLFTDPQSLTHRHRNTHLHANSPSHTAHMLKNRQSLTQRGNACVHLQGLRALQARQQGVGGGRDVGRKGEGCEEMGKREGRRGVRSVYCADAL